MMDETMGRSRGWNRLHVFGGLVALAFAVTLAVIVGQRLSDEALAVLAGAVCGVGAAIPTSLLIVAVSRRRDAAVVEERPAPVLYGDAPAFPDVIVEPPKLPVRRHYVMLGQPVEEE